MVRKYFLSRAQPDDDDEPNDDDVDGSVEDDYTEESGPDSPTTTYGG